jgi:hypothetical protein
MLSTNPALGEIAMKLSLDLTERQNEKLKLAAKSLGLRPEELAKAALNDLLDRPQEDFEEATAHALRKNKELYRRLS